MRADRDLWLQRLLAGILIAGLAIGIVGPMLAVLGRGFVDKDGQFCGFANFAAYADSPSLVSAAWHSLLIGAVVTVIVVAAAFVYAYGLTRSCMRGKGFFRAVAMAPLFAPSLLPALALIYLLGNQGVAKGLLGGQSLYGPIGIVLGLCFFAFPTALLVLAAALATTDARLYEAAQALGASRWRRFTTVTLPGAAGGLASAALITFTLAITDFGVPKVLGGQYGVLATEIYKQVVGQQNFQMGAVVACLLLIPATIAFAVDQWFQRRRRALVDAHTVPYVPSPDPLRDRLCFVACALIAAATLTVIGMAVYGSLVTFWPYNDTLTLAHFDFGARDGGGWRSLRNSLAMASMAAIAGSVAAYGCAYLVEKARRLGRARGMVRILAYLPLPVPGLVLGLGYVFFFSNPDNPLAVLYGGMAILALSTVIHFFTVAYVTCRAALVHLDPAIEGVGESLGAPFLYTLRRVTLPMTAPAVVEVASYLFINAMTTVSAVVFLYAPDTMLASISVLHLDDAGDTAPATAMCLLVFAVCLAARILALAMLRAVERSRWRRAR